MGVVLTESNGLSRRWEYSSPGSEPTQIIDYRGGQALSGAIAVNGENVAVDVARGRAERFLFSLGTEPALLDIQFDLMMRIKSLKLIVDGATVYTEGEAQAFTSPEELQALQAGPRIPSRVQLTGSPEAVEIRYRESTFQGVILLTVALSLLVVSLIMLNGTSVAWISLLTLLVGLGVIYLALLKLVNRTTIYMDRQELSLRRGPLPTLRSNIAGPPVDQIEGFTIEKHVQRDEDSKSTSYRLIVRQQDGGRKSLLEDPKLEPIVVIRNALAACRRNL